jgi:hypothetical protein
VLETLESAIAANGTRHPSPKPIDGRDRRGPCEHADLAGDRPAFHRQTTLGRLDVHERGLGEAHERAGRRRVDGRESRRLNASLPTHAR